MKTLDVLPGMPENMSNVKNIREMLTAKEPGGPMVICWASQQTPRTHRETLSLLLDIFFGGGPESNGYVGYVFPHLPGEGC